MNTTLTRDVGMFVNYSYQAKPTANFALTELNLPAKNRFNVGFNFNQGRFLGDLNVTYSDSAFWQDVLDDRYPRHDRVLHARQRRLRREVG